MKMTTRFIRPLALLLLLGWAAPVHAQFTTPIATVSGKSTNSNGFTIGPIDTTGATLIVIHVSDNNTTYTVTDSQTNSYTGLTAQLIIQRSRLFYVVSPSTSATHTFTIGVPAARRPCMSKRGPESIRPRLSIRRTATVARGRALSTPRLFTPASNGSLIISGLNADTTSTISIDSGFTISQQQQATGGAAVGGAIAHFVQTTAAALDPTWSWTGTVNPNTTVAIFRAAGGGSPPKGRLLTLGVGGDDGDR